MAVLALSLSGCRTEDAAPEPGPSSESEPLGARRPATSEPPSTAVGIPATATGALGTPRDERIGPPGAGRPVDVDLAIGACFVEVREGTDLAPVNRIAEHACEQPHDAEVVARFELEAEAGAAFPGDREMDRDTLRECLFRFAVYVGRAYATSTLRVSVMRPARTTWTAGDRTVQCSAYDPDLVPLIGTLRGSRR